MSIELEREIVTWLILCGLIAWAAASIYKSGKERKRFRKEMADMQDEA